MRGGALRLGYVDSSWLGTEGGSPCWELGTGDGFYYFDPTFSSYFKALPTFFFQFICGSVDLPYRIKVVANIEVLVSSVGSSFFSFFFRCNGSCWT